MSKKVHDNVRTIRLLKNISQEQMAEDLGISQSSYGKLERNSTKMSLERLEKIATIFGIKSFDIVHFDAAKATGITTNSKKDEETDLLPTVEDAKDGEVNVLLERIKLLENTGALLREQLRDKSDIIELLKKTK